jgi:hypothetical protein
VTSVQTTTLPPRPWTRRAPNRRGRRRRRGPWGACREGLQRARGGAPAAAGCVAEQARSGGGGSCRHSHAAGPAAAGPGFGAGRVLVWVRAQPAAQAAAAGRGAAAVLIAAVGISRRSAGGYQPRRRASWGRGGRRRPRGSAAAACSVTKDPSHRAAPAALAPYQSPECFRVVWGHVPPPAPTAHPPSPILLSPCRHPATSACPPACTAAGPQPRWRRASTCCVKSHSQPTPRRRGGLLGACPGGMKPCAASPAGEGGAAPPRWWTALPLAHTHLFLPSPALNPAKARDGPGSGRGPGVP